MSPGQKHPSGNIENSIQDNKNLLPGSFCLCPHTNLRS